MKTAHVDITKFISNREAQALPPAWHS